MRGSTIGWMAVGGALVLGACSPGPRDPRGVAHDEVLLQVTASGQAETAPNEARFSCRRLLDRPRRPTRRRPPTTAS